MCRAPRWLAAVRAEQDIPKPAFGRGLAKRDYRSLHFAFTRGGFRSTELIPLRHRNNPER